MEKKIRITIQTHHVFELFLHHIGTTNLIERDQ